MGTGYCTVSSSRCMYHMLCFGWMYVCIICMRGNKVSILRRRESLPAVLSRASTVLCYHPMYPSIPSIPDRESCRSITPAVRISSGLDYFLSWLPGHHGVVLSCPSPMIHDPRPSITPGCLPRLPPRPRKSSSVCAPPCSTHESLRLHPRSRVPHPQRCFPDSPFPVAIQGRAHGQAGHAVK